jgi:hypothetical protein
MIAWAWATLGTTAALAMAALGDLVSEEIRGWLDLVPKAVLRLAATQLEPAQRQPIYQGEWLPELSYALRGAESRPITRLIRGTTYAVGLLIAARRVARLSDRRSHRPIAERADHDLGLATPQMHSSIVARVPAATGRDLREWFMTLESGPPFARYEERAHWLSDKHGISHGYASAIVHEYEFRRRLRLNSA